MLTRDDEDTMTPMPPQHHPDPGGKKVEAAVDWVLRVAGWLFVATVITVAVWLMFVLPEGGRDEMPPLGDIGAATAVVRADVATDTPGRVMLTDVALVDAFPDKSNATPPDELLAQELVPATNVSRGTFEGTELVLFVTYVPAADPSLQILYAHDVVSDEPAGSISDVTNHDGLPLADSISCVRDRLGAADAVAGLIELAERWERDDGIGGVVSRCE